VSLHAPSPVPAPQGFQEPQLVLCADFSSPPALKRRRYTGARAQGVRYEAKGQEYLQARYGDKYLASPWLKFFADGRWRWCQPDGLLIDLRRGKVDIVEFKYQHTSDAWWQVRRLYSKVLVHLFPAPQWELRACEVVKWYDPATVFPERTVLASEIDMDTEFFKVHIWKP
jgi:hypothetical protein